jgi:biopolymer transport protein ExbB
MRHWLCLGALLTASTAIAQDTPTEAAPTEPSAEALQPLEAAFQKEYAYLLAERDGLRARLQEHRREAERAKTRAEADIDRLDARITLLETQSEQAQRSLEEIERSASEVLEADDTFHATLFQASNSLTRPGFDLALDQDAALADKGHILDQAFGEATKRLREGGTVAKTQGTWFDAEGVEHTGDVFLVGEIATYGVADGKGAALIPVGEGRLQGWREGGGTTGEALAAGQTTRDVGLFLHEGRTKRLVDRPPKTLSDILEAGGLVGYVILFLGGVALLLMALRALSLRSAGQGRELATAAVQHIERGEIDEAIATCKGSEGVPTRVVSLLLPHLEQDRSSLADRASEALLREAPRIDRFGTAILVIAAVAPLLGLLGTVTGMIATFDIITEFGTGDPRMLSGGISAALVTTQFGLIVAIPALLGGNLLATWGESVHRLAEGAALQVLNAVHEDDDEDPMDSPHAGEEGPQAPTLLHQASK